MTQSPLLSIITVNLNNRDGLKHTIESILSQKNRSFEYIVVDGDSTDGSREIIARNARNIDVIVSEKDSGIYEAMNKGVRLAKGKYCYFLNSGDTLLSPTVSNSMLKCLTDDFHTVAFNLLTKNIKGSTIRKQSPEVLSLPFFVLYALNHQAVVTLRSCLLENPFDERLRIASDWKFYLDEFLNNRLTYKRFDIDVALYDNSGISSSCPQMLQEERDLVLKEFGINFREVFDRIPSSLLFVTQTTRQGTFKDFLLRKLIGLTVKVTRLF